MRTSINAAAIARKFAFAAVAAAAIGATLALSAAPAEARGGRNAAIFGGLAAGIIGGTIIAGGAHAYHAPAYYGHCWRESRPTYDRWGNFRGYRKIRVCN